MFNPKVSIIIPTFNRADYLIEAIESVLKQTYENIEIIVSDNASTDNTSVVMKKYQNFNKVKYFINEKNIGMAPNWRKALNDYAEGDFAMILSDDDYLIDITYVEKAINSMIKNDTKLTFCNCLEVYEKNGLKTKERLIKYDLNEKNFSRDLYFNWRKILSYGNYFSIMLQTVIFDRNIAIKEFNAFSNPIISTDFQLWLSFFATGYNASYINIIGAAYRIHESNEIKRNKPDWNDWLRNFDSYLVPEKIALNNKCYIKSELIKHTNWMIRKSFSEWPGQFFKFYELNSLLKVLNNHDRRLKKQFLISIITHPITFIKLILSSNDTIYNFCKTIFKKVRNA